jgi:hypothetical protein
MRSVPTPSSLLVAIEKYKKRGGGDSDQRKKTREPIGEAGDVGELWLKIFGASCDGIRRFLVVGFSWRLHCAIALGKLGEPIGEAGDVAKNLWCLLVVLTRGAIALRKLWRRRVGQSVAVQR